MGDGVPAWLKSVLKKPQPTTTVAQDAVVADAPAVEPSSLARRIQALINKLPTPSHSTVDSTSSSTQLNNADDDHQVLQAPDIEDQELIQALSSPVIMNRTLDGGPSIWSILEHMGSPLPQGGNLPHSDVYSDMFSDTSSVMVYSPLLPAQGSLVELAESEVIVEEEGEEHELEPSPPPPIPGWSWTNTLPSVTSWFTQPTTTTTPPPPLLDESGQPMTPRTRERRLRAQRAWVPSKDQLSIQCMWWGYRMFLPPPVLDILDDKQLEATRRAAMITTALSWFFNNLPVHTLPLPLRPTLLLLQQLTPFLGSIGTFISWSWGVIKGYDQGCGVTLTATWLLPIALIPGTWFERDWPISPPPPDFAPLPSDSAPHPLSATSSPATIRENQALPTPDSTPMPTPIQSPQFLQSPQPTSPASLNPVSPLPSDLSHMVQSPPMSPRSNPNSPTVDTVSSPALSFVTAPNSPAPSSPKRLRASLAGLVAKSPIIRARRSLRNKRSTSSPKMIVSSPLNPSSTPHPSPSHYNTNNTPLPFSDSSITPYAVSTPLPYHNHHHYHYLDTPSDHRMHPSPPAHPNDLWLLQSPLWQCSPLPPEQPLHESP